MKYANLHLHSTYSDAQLTPMQLVLIGKSLGYHALALTDHETDGGVKLFMTHGHNQKVKATLALLKKEAREMGAQAALFGHTHSAYCCEEDGLWLLNPGSCGSYGGSAGLIETENGQITSCKILTHSDLMPDS